MAVDFGSLQVTSEPRRVAITRQSGPGAYFVLQINKRPVKELAGRMRLILIQENRIAPYGHFRHLRHFAAVDIPRMRYIACCRAFQALRR